jgi:hypothetical protein
VDPAAGEDDPSAGSSPAAGAPFPPARPESLSPALRGAGRAIELKFLADAATAARAERWVRARCAPDLHGQDGAYDVTTLHFDTERFDIFHGSTDGASPPKHRVRRYGKEAVVHAERKLRRGDRVEKRRAALPLRAGAVWIAAAVGCAPPARTSALRKRVAEEREVRSASDPVAADHGAALNAAWFFEALDADGLRPVCRTSYRRRAFTGPAARGVLRVTFDRDLRALPVVCGADGPCCAVRCVSARGTDDLLHGRVILEFKFTDALPADVRRFLADTGLAPRRLSKYRTVCAALGLGAG